MANEASFWGYIRRIIPRKADFQRHEDTVASGIPDVSYGWENINGWIELKYYPAWKVRRDTNHIDSWTNAQKHWLRKRYLAGGHCFLFVKIGKEYLLFGGEDIYRDLNECRREFLISIAAGYWKNRININELREILCR